MTAERSVPRADQDSGPNLRAWAVAPIAAGSAHSLSVIALAVILRRRGAGTHEPQRRLRVEEAVRQDGTRFPKGTVVLSGSVAFDMHEPKSGIVGGLIGHADDQVCFA